MSSIAIIGAGLSGMVLATRLSPKAEVTVFEKSRGYGGRMSTRRMDDFQFDHGAQYFTAHGAGFQGFLDTLLEAGHVAKWSPRLATLTGNGSAQPLEWNAQRYVATPGMNSICKAMAEGQNIVPQTEVGSISQEGNKWALQDAAGTPLGPFDWVISTAPADQSARLMPEAFVEGPALAAVQMQGCYALMVGLAEPQTLDWDAATVKGAPLGWIAVNATKPGRGTAQTFVCQSTNDWAEDNLERDQAEVQQILLDSFEAVTGIRVVEPAYLGLHRWRYAAVSKPASAPFLLDAGSRLAACGDWCGAGKIEAAFDSASALVDALVENHGLG